jgi:hypothetical protein
VIDAADIPLLTDTRKVEMLEAFGEGYFQAAATLAGKPAKTEDDESDSRKTYGTSTSVACCRRQPSGRPHGFRVGFCLSLRFSLYAW